MSAWPAGDHLSLHRLNPTFWGNAAASWDALPPTPGEPYPWPETYVLDRYVFYNDSTFDGDDPSPGASDDEATVIVSHSLWESREAFTAWTESEAFRAAHGKSRSPEGTVLGPPRFEGFEVVL